jgi:hypothetical protein
MVGAVLMIATTNAVPALPDPNSPAAIGWIAVVIAAVATAANQVWKLIQNLTGKGNHRLVSPQPLEVTATKQFVTKEEHDRHTAWNQQEHNNLFSKLGGVERGVREAMKAETDQLHDRITDVAKQNAAQEAKQDLMNQRIVQMDGKLDRLVERSTRG